MVVGNLQKARKKYGRMLRILGMEGENVRVSVTLFKSVVQAVLLLGSETWMLNSHMDRTLGGFQRREYHRLIGKQMLRLQDRSWKYPPAP